jgi:hypothetical protein
MARPEVTGRKPGSPAQAGSDQASIRGPPSIGSYTLAEWCKRHNLSLSMYYKMRSEGWGPRTMSVGARELELTQFERKSL